MFAQAAVGLQTVDAEHGRGDARGQAGRGVSRVVVDAVDRDADELGLQALFDLRNGAAREDRQATGILLDDRETLVRQPFFDGGVVLGQRQVSAFHFLGRDRFATGNAFLQTREIAHAQGDAEIECAAVGFLRGKRVDRRRDFGRQRADALGEGRARFVRRAIDGGNEGRE